MEWKKIMPRRLRNLINTAQADANKADWTLDNANKLIANADDSLCELDEIIDALKAQGYIEIETTTTLPLIGEVKLKSKILIPQKIVSSDDYF
jgi:hypothetical protein